MRLRRMIQRVFEVFAGKIGSGAGSGVSKTCDPEQNEPSRLPVPFGLKLLVIADTHNCLTEEELVGKDADVCVLLGDLSGRDMQTIRRCVTSMPIYGVLGNHDDWDLYESFGVENIHGKVVKVKGVKIAGLQGSIRYKDSDWPLYTDEESSAIADNMAPADILISHDSPKNFHGDWDFAHRGLQGVSDYCEKHSVPLNLHGHHHCKEAGVLDNGTLSLCCHKVMLIDTENLGLWTARAERAKGYIGRSGRDVLADMDKIIADTEK